MLLIQEDESRRRRGTAWPCCMLCKLESNKSHPPHLHGQTEGTRIETWVDYGENFGLEACTSICSPLSDWILDHNHIHRDLSFSSRSGLAYRAQRILPAMSFSSPRINAAEPRP